MKKTLVETQKRMFSRMLLLCSMIGMLFGFTACDDDDENPAMKGKPSITVLLGVNGKGNNDYSALIYKAIEKWEKNPNVDMTIYHPKSNEEATKLYKDWAKKTANGVKSLMVPANGQFEEVVNNTRLDLKANQQVLAFEMTLKQPLKGIHSFEISHPGISYLAGKMASKCDEAVVLIGSRTAMLNEAEAMFHKGYGSDKKYQAIELSKQFNGFNMPDVAEQKAKENPDAFILPLAGLSNNGVYEFLNKCKDEDKIMAAGMDVNCNSLSTRIPFSYIINIDKAVDLHIQCWYDEKPWPDIVLGLAEGMTSIVMNPDFTEVAGVSKADFEEIYKKYFDEAAALDKK